MRAGIAFSEDGRARAGMGIDAADFVNAGASGLAITNFDNEMVALYRASPSGAFTGYGAWRRESGRRRGTRWGSGARSSMRIWTAGSTCAVVNGHIDATVRNIRSNGYAQPPHLFLNQGGGRFRDVARRGRGGVRRAEGGARAGVRRFR